MLRNTIARLGVAVATAALMVPALASTATAAPAYPKVPSVAAVAKVYPHFAGGTVYASKIDKVYGPGKKCNQSKRIKGAVGNSASYLTADSASPTGATPGYTVIAYRLPSVAKAKALITTSGKRAKTCPGGGTVVPGIKSTKVKKLKVKLGDSSQGYTVTVKTNSGKYISNTFLVRKGKVIVTVLVSSMDGKTPALKKSVKAAKLALKTAS